MAYHHLDDATLVRYVSGDLDTAACIVAASHLAMCETCRRSAHDAEELGGEMLRTCAGKDLAEDLLERILGKIGAASTSSLRISEDVTGRQSGDVPLPLQRYVGSRLCDVTWKKVAPGVAKHEIRAGEVAGSSLFLLKIAAGKAMPEHGHGGGELTLVLSGAYRDSLGRFGPGDIADLDEHVEHQPRVEEGAECICLVATEAPTRFKGILSRLMQPFLGI